MPIVLPAGSPSATGGPTFGTNAGPPSRTICRFGGLPLPNGQGGMAWLDLNDVASWFLQDIGPQHDFRQIMSAHQTYRASGVYTGDDFGPRTVTLPLKYYEGTLSLSAQISKLSQAGEQYLTFDNLTALLVKFNRLTGRRMLRKFAPLWWEFQLEFFARTPWWVDLSPTAPVGSPFALTGSATGSLTSFNFAYPGTVFGLPTFTLTVPVGNGAVINSLVLKNALSGEQLTLTFPGGLAAATAYTVTIDCGAWSVVDQNGTVYDPQGSFPQLYGPANQVNTFQATLTTASGATTGVTLGVSYSSRWEI